MSNIHEVVPFEASEHLQASRLTDRFSENASAVADLICRNVAAPVFVLSAENRVVAASEELLEMLSYAPGQFLGHPISEFLGRSSMRFFKDASWPGPSDRDRVEDTSCELVTGKGQILRARLTGRRAPQREHTQSHVTCVVEDLTERNQIETKFSTLFALSPVPMMIRRLEDTRILDVNPAFLSLTGHAAADVCDRPMEDFAVFEPSHLRQRFERDLRAGAPLRAVEMRIKGHDGLPTEVRASAAVLETSGQQCALLILQDTARCRFDEQQLLKAIEIVMSDTSWFSREVVEKLAVVRMPRGPTVLQGGLDDLTKREREVLAMISHGWSDIEIAGKLSLTRSTIRNHKASLYSKINVHSRSSAIVWARERALNVIHPAAAFGQQPGRRMTMAKPEAKFRHG